MTNHQHSDPRTERPTSNKKWAPWWIYVVVLLGANYLRVYFMQGSSLPEPVVVVIAIAQAILLFVIITELWRYTQREKT